jgi:hypothetical protein
MPLQVLGLINEEIWLVTWATGFFSSTPNVPFFCVCPFLNVTPYYTVSLIWYTSVPAIFSKKKKMSTPFDVPRQAGYYSGRSRVDISSYGVYTCMIDRGTRGRQCKRGGPGLNRIWLIDDEMYIY